MSESPAPYGAAEADLNHTALPPDALALLDLLQERFRTLYQNDKSRQPFLFDAIHVDLYTADGPLRLTIRREDNFTDADSMSAKTDESPLYTNQLTGEVYLFDSEAEHWNYRQPLFRFTDADMLHCWLKQRYAP